MTVQIGDKVRFLNDVGSGVVVRIEKNIVYVSDEDGFERPSPLTQVVVVESINNQQKKAIKAEVASINNDLKTSTKQIIKPVMNDDAIYLALNPSKFPFAENENVSLYLLNDTNNVALFHLYSINNEQVSTLKAGFLEPNTRELLYETKINKIDSTIGYQVIQYKSNSKHNLMPILSGEVKLKSLDIIQSKLFKFTPFFDHQALLFQLKTPKENIEKEQLEKLAATFSEGKSENQTIKKVKTDINEILEIDLHIEQLRDDIRHLLPAECLAIQLEHFQKIMNQNAQFKGKRIVFIHGVGQGKLKNELLKLLAKRYPKCEVQDASFQEYGFGATRITIR